MRNSHANSYNCLAKEGLQKEKEEDKVHQFLMGLNEVYVGVRSNILMMQPLTSLDNVYNILLQDEKQRQVVPITQFNSESASFNANSNKILPQFLSQKHYAQRVNFDQNIQKTNFDQNKASLSCKYCKKPGHTIEKCYKLHGFPPNFKFTKGKRIGTVASIEGQPSGTSDSAALYSSSRHESLVPGLTKEQYSQLLNLLQHSTLGESNSQHVLMGSANFAGNTSSLPLCLNDSSTVRMLTSVSRRAHSMKKLLELGRMDQGLYKFHLPCAEPSLNANIHVNSNFVAPSISCSA
uniref:Uncharacterized protein n=1 Tax=Nicotiana tabacum TaxID=4097 RepID=A0A1S3YN69_TOBAC|nr:PREDICTED: uncharacterized protein LOC107777888 [Nicotiana tabacum]